MKLISTLAVAASLFAGANANATPVTLDFENQTSFASLNLPESDYGFTASGALLALANDGLADNPTGNYFSGNPSGLFVMFVDPLLGGPAVLSSSLGFQTSVTFQYSAAAVSTIYARDALGAVLGSFTLAANSVDPNAPFNAWSLGTIYFSGLASSIDFSEASGTAAFDDVTVNPVPLPAAALMFPFALAAMRLATRKRREV